MENEFLSIEINVKFAKGYGKSLLVNLAVVLFCWAEGCGRIGDGLLHPIREAMRNYRSNSTLTRITF